MPLPGRKGPPPVPPSAPSPSPDPVPEPDPVRVDEVSRRIKSWALDEVQLYPDDWEGEDAASLEELIRDIVAGKVKHKRKLELDAAEIANIAAYWGQAGK